eukprot:3846849-Pleurochrysis_carterae.AAC.1
MIAQVEDSPPAVGRDVRPNLKAVLASSAVPSIPTLAEMIHNRGYGIRSIHRWQRLLAAPLWVLAACGPGACA